MAQDDDTMTSKKSSRALGLLVACVFALEACGDGEEGKERPPDCAQMCRVYAAAGCEEFDERECVDDCTELGKRRNACAIEYRGIIWCVARAPAIKLACADGQPVVTGTDCAQELYEYAQCGRLSGGVAGAAGQSGTSPVLCSEECPYSGDGVCDDGGPGASYGDCTYGTDCADCGVRVWTAPGEPICSNECQYRANGTCDDGGPRAQSGKCTYGTDCADCGARAIAGLGGGGAGGSGPVEICTDECTTSADGLCDDGGLGADYSVCELGTDCTDCGPRTVGGETGTGGGTGGTGIGGAGGSAGSVEIELCSERCSRAGDGVCDDGGPGASDWDCEYGTDCTDCGIRLWAGRGEPVCLNECTYSADGECDDGGPSSVFSLCAPGTDCIDCGVRDSASEGLAGTGGGTSVPAEWTCSARYYGSADGCDCGCGAADPDCQGFGCTVASCSAPSCRFCHAADGSSESCDPNAWTLIALPDTQYYSLSYPDVFESQTRWIVENRERLNIQMVIHEGDLVEIWDSIPEWDVADASMGLLFDANIPLLATPGDHDHEGQTPDGSTEYFQQYFPASRFNADPWWGGNYNDNTNQYVLRTIANDDYIFVGLDFCPSSDEIDWANDVLDEHPSRKAILVTHALIDDNGAYYGASDCSRYQGDTTYIFDDLIRHHDNLRLALCGHMHLNDGEHHRTVRNLDNSPVHLLLANYQMREVGGNGRLRIMTFAPARDQIQVQTYSPYTGQFETDEDSQFEIPYEMEGGI
jgi:hypothetical protein